jgi:transcriptional regulator of acetoin/glycerol metabolism
MKSQPMSADFVATQPSASTGGVGPSVARLVLQWVFPSVGISELTDKHSFGRDPSCDCVLPGTEVSRRHADVKMGALPMLRDLGSRNGVFVNGRRVQEQLLGPGVVVRIGEWVGITRELVGPTADVAPLLEIAPGWYGGPLLAARMDALRRVATSGLPVVIEGATGTGKEGVARALHAWSGRAKPFVAVDCGALPEQLAESLLFGHRKGAFSGADRANLGYLRAAEGGTVFLDEILNLGLAVQAKLLRVLERREVVPVGESQAIPLDVHFTCAAQEPLAVAVQEDRFRADLMARLEGATITLPALRERTEDIVPLFFKFLEQHGGAGTTCEPKFIESLLLYDWPLNVRELLLLARRLVAVHGGELLKRSMLPERMRTHEVTGAPPARTSAPARKPTDDDEAFASLVAGLRAHGGNLTKAAAALGLTRARAYRLLEARPEFDLGSIRKGPGS